MLVSLHLQGPHLWVCLSSDSVLGIVSHVTIFFSTNHLMIELLGAHWLIQGSTAAYRDCWGLIPPFGVPEQTMSRVISVILDRSQSLTSLLTKKIYPSENRVGEAKFSSGKAGACVRTYRGVIQYLIGPSAILSNMDGPTTTEYEILGTFFCVA